jgi:inhibitor of KinA
VASRLLLFQPLGDQAIQIKFSDEINEKMVIHILAFRKELEKQKDLPLIECVQTYTTLSVYYDPLKIGYQELVQRIEQIAITSPSSSTDINLSALAEETNSQVIEIPTLYGGEMGPDLEYVAKYNRLTEHEIIQIHSEHPYLIFMMGFSPGFPYLGGVSEQISTPRLGEPRRLVAGGSVGIAGQQTGIYPMDSPGGWRIIGRTPLELYNPNRVKPFLLKAGNYIKFKPITQKEFDELVYSNQKQNDLE